MTTLYLIRHSKPLKVNHLLNTDSLQIQNEKSSLSIEGELLANQLSENQELNHIDVLYTSNYVRAIQTSKYIASKNNIDINIISNLGERKFGVSKREDLPKDFERKQFLDENYKIGPGESQLEVRNRMFSTIMDMIEKNKDKNICIVSHATAISYFLRTWCNITIINNQLRYSFQDKILLEGYLNYCEIFKLEFENNELLNIQVIRK